jgi:eukaryotic-like serine/threonine-protein kinase
MDLLEQVQRSLGDAYRVERELGGGGMSRVFVAEDRSLARRVVIKLLSPELSAGLNTERFRREVQLAARLQHACIVPLLAAGEAASLPYYTMPFVDGESLRARLSRQGALPIADVIRVIRDCAEALSYAHESGVIHRDIKPDNILLTKHHALITDFGVAKALTESNASISGSLTGLGMALGTPSYMAPEQAMADPHCDHRADLYSLGVVAYECLAGKPLFGQRTPQAMLAAHAIEAPPPILESRPDTPPALASLVMRLLSKTPDARPSTGEEILTILDSVATPGGVMTPAPAVREASRPGRRLSMMAATGALAAALIASVWGASRLVDTPAPARAAPTTSIRSIAVLPFEELGADKRDAYFADGVSEQLIDALSKLPQLRVAGRTSSFGFRGQVGNVKEIGDKLAVSAILTGSVQRAADNIRVRAQLTSTDSGFTVWSQTYDRKMTDVFAVQDEITKAIVSALRVQFSGGDSLAMITRSTNPETYELYLKGLYNFNKRGANIIEAVKLFQQAIAKDSLYAPAWAALAHAYRIAMDWSFVPTLATIPKARAAALRAIALDSTLADGHGALADMYCQHDYDWAAADREYRRALQLNPGSATTHYFYAWCIGPLGRFEDALAHANKARELDPLNPQIFSAMGKAYYLSRRYDEGLQMYKIEEGLGTEAAAGHVWRALYYARKKDFARALSEAEKGYAMSGRSPLFAANLASVLAFAGQRDSARALLARLERDPSRPSYTIGAAYAALAQDNEALDWLERAYEDRSDWITMINGSPEWDHLRSHPRFLAIWNKLRIPQ